MAGRLKLKAESSKIKAERIENRRQRSEVGKKTEVRGRMSETGK